MDVATNTDASPGVPLEHPQSLIARTWDELGFKIRPLRARVFIRTELPPQRIGLIWLPPKQADFYGGLGHQKLCTATILSVGRLAKLVKPGDRVCFQRMQFGYIRQMEDKTYVGWIEQEQLAGHPDDTDFEPFKA